MNQALLSLDLMRSVPSLEVPVVFFLGRYDRHVDARIADAYLAGLRAPVKGVPFEEPALFNAIIVREQQSIGVRTAAPIAVVR